MKKSIFKFKHFEIDQTNSPFKVGTDGVLLGTWANCKNAQTVLDVGTGTGLIALMVAQRCEAKIYAIEINSLASQCAAQNFSRSKWFERLFLENISIQNFTKKSKQKFDLIICNPPYFTNSVLSKNSDLATARHTSNLFFEELFQCFNILLNNNGLINLIIPFNLIKPLTEIALKKHFFLTVNTNIYPTLNSKPKRALLQFEKQNKSILLTKLTIEISRHNYTGEYRQLCKSFYLKF